MAVPQPTDARVPCPACRAPIHPIAGRCRHCKADLGALRQTRPAAAVALPPLAARPRVATPAAVPVVGDAIPQPPSEWQRDDSQPILPPRPTGRMEASGTSKRSTWRSWPVLVIALASVAIIVAVVLMMFPPGGGDAGTAGGKHVLEPPPAPDRMDTNPAPSAPHAQLQPDLPHADPIPAPTPPAPPRNVPTPVPNDPDPDPFQGLGGSVGGSINGQAFGGAQTGLMFALLKHSCDRAKACGNMDDMMKMTCDMQLPSAPAPTCAAAKRCLEKIDQLDCSSSTNDLSQVTQLMMSMNDCIEAMRC